MVTVSWPHQIGGCPTVGTDSFTRPWRTDFISTSQLTLRLTVSTVPTIAPPLLPFPNGAVDVLEIQIDSGSQDGIVPVGE